MAPPFEKFCQSYSERFGFELLVVDAGGKVVSGELRPTACECGGRSDLRRLQAAQQTKYWGDTVINLCCDSGYAIWGVPVMENNDLTGALIVQGIDLENCSGSFHESVQAAANGLLRMAVEANYLSRAEVELARQRAVSERDRFLAIEAGKRDEISDDLRSIYISEEPELLASIKGGDLGEARAILNRILTGIYGLAGERMELLKSCVLELVVMMSRAAVEAGAEPAKVLGRNYHSLVELSDIDDEEVLSDWLRRMLETLIDQIGTNESYPHSLLLLRATQYMKSHLHEHLGRDEVARVAGVSPSHFSKLVTERMGRSFSQLLAQLRVNRAKELLARTDRSLSEIAIECGFCDQSHLNKVFRSHTAVSPGNWRKEHR